MATESNLIKITAVAASDLSTKQYYAVTLDTSGTLALATAAKNIDGVLQDKPASGQAGAVAIFGITKVALSDTVTVGQRLEVASGGTFVPVASGTAVAKALEAGATGNIIRALLLKSNAVYS